MDKGQFNKNLSRVSEDYYLFVHKEAVGQSRGFQGRVIKIHAEGELSSGLREACCQIYNKNVGASSNFIDPFITQNNLVYSFLIIL